jgi:hypothetical protein
MVRRGSTVRVRQRAYSPRSTCKAASFVVSASTAEHLPSRSDTVSSIAMCRQNACKSGCSPARRSTSLIRRGSIVEQRRFDPRMLMNRRSGAFAVHADQFGDRFWGRLGLESRLVRQRRPPSVRAQLSEIAAEDHRSGRCRPATPPSDLPRETERKSPVACRRPAARTRACRTGRCWVAPSMMNSSFGSLAFAIASSLK